MGQLNRIGAPIAVMAIVAAMQGITSARASTYAPPKANASTVAQQHIGTVESSEDGSFVSSMVTPGRFEVTFSGKRFESRDRVERYLLYRAALLARQNGAGWFGLLYLPGEAGATAHPPRTSSDRPGFGHWQPHWNYYITGMGWQPWHPEWGVTFWAEDIDLARVEQYNAHAMIELGIGRRPQNNQPIFAVDEVIRDLQPAFR